MRFEIWGERGIRTRLKILADETIKLTMSVGIQDTVATRRRVMRWLRRFQEKSKGYRVRRLAAVAGGIFLLLIIGKYILSMLLIGIGIYGLKRVGTKPEGERPLIRLCSSFILLVGIGLFLLTLLT